jgi:outer membrane lipoprotein SlyB
MFKALLSLLVISILSGCASADFGSPNTYQRYDVQRIGQMEQATVIRVRSITIESNSDSSGLSSIVSSVAGAFLGSQIIGNGRGRYISGALSGSVTGVVAQRVGSMMAHHSGLEVFLRRANGQTVVVTQVDDQQFVPGERVFLINSGSGYRITH